MSPLSGTIEWPTHNSGMFKLRSIDIEVLNALITDTSVSCFNLFMICSEWQARECQNHIADSLEKVYPIHCIMGRKNIEVLPRSIAKSHIAAQIMSKLDPEFVLCVGDDRADEDMFQLINEMQKSNTYGVKWFWTCTVGSKSSGAQYFMTGVVEVLNVLSALGGMNGD